MRHAAVFGTLLVLVALSVQVDSTPLQGPTPIPNLAKKTSPASDRAWFGKAMEGIEASEYQFSHARDGRWGAPNRSQDLRTTVDREGMRLASLTRDASRWSFGLQLTRFGRDGHLAAPELPSVSALAGRAQLVHGPKLTEWYINDRRGLEHGFTVISRPDGSPNRSDVVLEMRVQGDLRGKVTSDATGIQWHEAGNADKVALSYAGLKVRDAKGQTLRAGLRLADSRMQIWFDDTGAVYPVEVDPIMTTPLWKKTNLIAVSLSAGDVNGDGYSDIILGVPNFFGGTPDTSGRAFVFCGQAGGPSLTPSASRGEMNPTPGYSNYGGAVAAEDVTGDGKDDLVVGALNWDLHQHDQIYLPAGAVFLYTGYSGFCSSGDILGSSNATLHGTQDGEYFGEHVAAAGDINNDGHGDIIVSAPNHEDNNGTNTGAAYVFLGSGSGLGNGQALNGMPITYNFGHAIAGCDVNGDGFSDVLVGDPVTTVNPPPPQHGQVAVYWGSQAPTFAAPDQIITEGVVRIGFGGALACGDVNHDGFADAIISNPTASGAPSPSGVVYGFRGSSGGLETTPTWQVGGGFVYGTAVAFAGDVNHDGFGDVLVGDPYFNGGQIEEGRAQLFLGSASAAGLLSAPIWFVESDSPRAHMGTPIAGAGDVNNDGYADILVSAPNEDNVGATYLYLGGPTIDVLDPLCATETECPGTYIDSISNGVVELKDSAQLAEASVRRSGTTTDGVSRLLLRKESDQPVTFSLRDYLGNLLSSDWGTLQRIDGSQEGPSVTAPAEIGNKAYVVYRPPSQFPGSDDPLDRSNGVRVQVKVDWAGHTEQLYIQLYPPPVVLVHGLWSNHMAWKGLANFLQPLGFEVCSGCLVDYGLAQPAPEFDPAIGNMPSDQLAISSLRNGANNARNERRSRGIAVSQVDVVAHSLGGLITRARVAWPGRPYRETKNYEAGEFHRLITVGTPHFGSPLANWLVDHQCDLLQAGDKTLPIPLKTAMAIAGRPVKEGVLGLRTNSRALRDIGETDLRTYVIAAREPSLSKTEALLDAIPKLTGHPLTTVDGLLDGEGNHDTIVPLLSQLGGSTIASIFPGIVHAAFAQSDTGETASQDIWNQVKSALLMRQEDLKDKMPASNSLGDAPDPPSCILPPGPFGPLSGTATLTPDPGTVVQPGQTVTVTLTITGGNPVDGTLLEVGDTFQVIEGPGPFSLDYVVPSGWAGAIPMRADTFGPGAENYTATSSLQVNETGPAASLIVTPKSVTMDQVGDISQIIVTAKQANGTLTDVTEAEAGTTYTTQSGGTAIVSVSPTGLVEAEGAGQDTVIVHHGGLQSSIPVSVVITNHSPAIQPVADVTLPPGASLNVPITVTDQDGDTLQIDKMAGPSFAQVVDLGGGAGQLQVHPGLTDLGSSSVLIRATDDGTPPFGTSSSARVTVCNCGDPGCVVSPGIVEECNGRDDDCDGTIDEGFDADEDGYTTCGGDCNDQAWYVNPGMVEECDNFDDDCDGQVDEGFDLDGDGYTSCQSPYADCNDANVSIHPGVPETCNNVDDNCNGYVDEVDPFNNQWDKDLDGWTTCALPVADCDDNDARINGVEREYVNKTCFDLLDNDCDGVVDWDCALDVLTASNERVLLGSVSPNQPGGLDSMKSSSTDDSYESITESDEVKRVAVYWTFELPPPNAYTGTTWYHLRVEGLRVPGNGDEFAFSYAQRSQAGPCTESTGETYYPALTVSKTVDDDRLQVFQVGPPSYNTVSFCVKVEDSNQGADSEADALQLDKLYLMPIILDAKATAEQTQEGTRFQGTYISTQSVGNGQEGLREALPNNRLIHTYTFASVPFGYSHKIYFEARRSNNLDSDDFKFSYALPLPNGLPGDFTDIPGAVIITPDSPGAVLSGTFGLPGMYGKVFIRIQDTSGGTHLDSVYIDYLAIKTPEP